MIMYIELKVEFANEFYIKKNTKKKLLKVLILLFIYIYCTSCYGFIWVSNFSTHAIYLYAKTNVVLYNVFNY